MSALVLKIIACVAMLLDHIGFACGILFFRIIGRVSFPIYLFLIYNGYRHTSNPLRYALRLGAFAVISQVPFSLFVHHVLWHSTGNVMFTLLAAMLCLWLADAMSKNKYGKWFSLVPALVLFFLYYKRIFWTEYGDKAILVIMVLFLFDGKQWYNKVLVGSGLLVSMNYSWLLAIAKNVLRGEIQVFPALALGDQMQLFAMVAIPLILLYNGKKGTLPGGTVANKVQQYGFYLFYPMHLLILWLICIL